MLRFRGASRYYDDRYLEANSLRNRRGLERPGPRTTADGDPAGPARSGWRILPVDEVGTERVRPIQEVSRGPGEAGSTVLAHTGEVPDVWLRGHSLAIPLLFTTEKRI